MASRTFANMGLRAGYSAGEDGWADAMTEDLRKLSVMTQPVVFSFVAELPDAPTDGDRHILSAEDSNSGAANSIIYFDVDTWIYFTPLTGWEVWNIGDSTKYRFNGAAWAAIAGAGAVTADTVTYDAGENGDSNSTETTVAAALDDLYERVRSVSGGSVEDSNSGGPAGEDSNSGGADDPMDPAFFFVGGIGDVNRRVTYVTARSFSLPISLTGSQTWAETPTTDDSNSASVAFDIQKNGVSIGTVTFDGGSQTGSFTFASGQTFVAGDRLGIVAPASLGALAGISITLMGTRTS